MTAEPQFNALLKAARSNNHRHLVVLAGDQNWCLQRLQPLLTGIDRDSALWLGAGAPEDIQAVPAGKANQWLGQERNWLVFNGWSGFDVDAFGAISGTLCGGGVMFLLMPATDNWARFADPEHRRINIYPEQHHAITGHYLERLQRLIETTTAISLLQQDCKERWAASIEPVAQQTIDNDSLSPCRTTEQQSAVMAIERVARGHRRRPLVLTADRGRGKSAALGIAAARLLQQGLEQVVVTAPALACVETLFQHAALLLDGAQIKRGELTWQGHTLCFRAPDDLIQQGCDCDLMLVDEAAALPVPLLEKLLHNQSRIVFSSTIHGYEGTGRGFALRFRRRLDAITPKWKALHINQPIRWGLNDPLEKFIFAALLLDAAPAEAGQLSGVTFDQCQWHHFDRAALAADETLVRQVFGLLVLAHYRTRPFDLRHFLDGPNIDVYGLLHNGQMVATVLTAAEGQLPDTLEEPIWYGQRRVRGHLLAQSLSNHVGLPEAVRLKGVRVLRIAVHPALQGQGLGHAVLQRLYDSVLDQGVDYIGTSYGATSDLVSFWQGTGMVPARIGLTREAASGCYSLMMLKGISQQGLVLVNEACQRFVDNLLLQLPDSLQAMEPELATQLLISGYRHRLDTPQPLCERDSVDLLSYCNGQRLYESCLLSIRRLLLWALSSEPMDDQALVPLVARVLQLHDWARMAESLQLQGQKQAQAEFRQRVGRIALMQESSG